MPQVEIRGTYLKFGDRKSPRPPGPNLIGEALFEFRVPVRPQFNHRPSPIEQGMHAGSSVGTGKAHPTDDSGGSLNRRRADSVFCDLPILECSFCPTYPPFVAGPLRTSSGRKCQAGLAGFGTIAVCPEQFALIAFAQGGSVGCVLMHSRSRH